MSFKTKLLALLLSLTIGNGFLFTHKAYSANGVTLYTPYTKISVPPGESLDYSIEVINNSDDVKNVDVSVSGIPKDWSYDLKSNGLLVNQVSVLPKERKTLSLKIDVPLKVSKGNYRFRVNAGSYGSLPLVVNVTKEGTYKTEFTTDQSNMEGHATATFTFNGNLRNRTAEKQLYALKANTAPGWEVIFKANYKQATSADVEPNSTSNVVIEINPPDNIPAGTYQIPVQASTSSTSATLDLQVVITGSFGMELTTPSGLLSTDITAGEKKQIELLLKNTGSSILKNVELTSAAPSNWEVTYEPKKVDEILAGGSAVVTATVKADKKAIPGDYVTNFEAKTPEVSSKASFRISVETPLLWGWVGVFIILIALGSIYYLFRKYGRR